MSIQASSGATVAKQRDVRDARNLYCCATLSAAVIWLAATLSGAQAQPGPLKAVAGNVHLGARPDDRLENDSWTTIQ